MHWEEKNNFLSKTFVFNEFAKAICFSEEISQYAISSYKKSKEIPNKHYVTIKIELKRTENKNQMWDIIQHIDQKYLKA